MTILQSLPTLEPGQSLKGLVAGPAGALEFKLETPRAEPRAIAVICHPHPLYQGSMDNKVVYTLSRIALAADCVSLRFQFRGVGGSDGPHAQGQGETQDTAFLLQALREAYPRLPAVLCGFSFGAYMALSVAAQDQQLAGLVTIAPPLAYAGSAAVPQPHCDWLLMHGDADEVVSFDETRQRAEAMARPPEWVRVDGVGHFFHGQLNALRDTVTPWLQQRIQGGSHGAG